MCTDGSADALARTVVSRVRQDLGIHGVGSTNQRKALQRYIADKRWALFNTGQTGKMTFDEFYQSEWATYLSMVEPGECRVPKRAIFSFFLGDPNDPKSGWHTPMTFNITRSLYDQLDKEGKGYVNFSDLRTVALSEFKSMDRDDSGFLSRKEMPGD